MRRVIGMLALAGAVSATPAVVGAPPAPAAAVTTGPFAQIRKGDRARITLRSKSQFTGLVRAVTPGSVTIDLSMEEKGMEGQMTFGAELVLKAEALKAWDEKEVEKRRVERERRKKEAEAEAKRIAAQREAARKAEEEAARKAAEEAAKKGGTGAPADAGGAGVDDLAKGIELLKEFPPKEGWGTAPDKTLDWLKSKLAVVGVALTASEQKFVDNYDLWLKAKQTAEQPETPPAAPAAAPGAPAEGAATAPAPAGGDAGAAPPAKP